MSKIRLYRNCKILEEKNFQVDDIESYLSTLTPVKEFNPTQYIKQGLDIEVKVTLDQTYLDKQWTNMYNYCSIEMDNGGQDNTYYYFIREMQWISKDAIKLVLHQDVINTYKDAVQLTDKTTIQRMHKDRFISDGKPALTEDIETWLDDSTKWDWSTNVGEIVGIATFYLSEDFRYRIINNPTTILIQGDGADVYNFDWDADFMELKVTAYKQGEQSPIPQGRIRITVTSDAIQRQNIYKKVDKISEGFDTPLFRDNRQDILYESNENKDSFYLIYKTRNAFQTNDPDAFIYNNVVDCFVTSDSGYESNVVTSVRIDATALASGERYYVSFPVGADGKHTPNSFASDIPEPKAGLSIKVVGDNGKTTTLKVFKVNQTRNKQTTISFVRGSNNHIIVTRHELKRDNFEERFDYLGDFGASIEFKDISQIDVFTSNGNYANNQNFYDLLVRKYKGHLLFNNGSITRKTSASFSEVDRTDPKLLKIIKLPYSLKVGFYTEWNETEKLFKLNSTAFDQIHIDQTVWCDKENLTPASIFLVGDLDVNVNSTRDDNHESKLLHSDFYQQKVVYDSFSYTFKAEEFDMDYIKLYTDPLWYNDGEFGFYYIVSTNVSSTFLFDFSTSWTIDRTIGDYPYIMVVNRNLEVPIYNNYYLNYLRNGYNYDIKNKQARQVASGIGIGLSAASLVAGIALSATGVGSAMGATAIVGGIAGLAGSLTGAITNSAQADRALQQKEEQAKNQAATVQGADDIGLLSYYAEDNKPKMVVYRASDATKERIADLFYYCGYKCDYQAVPDTTSRYWFNYIQCDPVYEETNLTAKMGKECKAELTNKYQQGITVLHKHDNSYDFAQTKENWETWLIA